MSEIRIIHAGERAALDPAQSGFAHGYGLFETIRLSGGRLHFWTAHWERLAASAAALGFELPVDADAALQAIRELVRADALGDATIKLSLLKEQGRFRLYVYSRPTMPVPAVARLQLNGRYPLNEHSLLAGHKTHNYMEAVLLLERCRAASYTDTLRLNTAGQLAETTVANLFFIKSGRLCTPSLRTGILPGVIRSVIVESREVEQGVYFPDDMRGADALFLTNSSFGILSVDEVDGEGLSLRLDSGSHPDILDLKRMLDLRAEALSADLG